MVPKTDVGQRHSRTQLRGAKTDSPRACGGIENARVETRDRPTRSPVAPSPIEAKAGVAVHAVVRVGGGVERTTTLSPLEIYVSKNPKLLQAIRDAFDAPRKRGPNGEDSTEVEFEWAQEPKPKPVERPKKPAHTPGSGVRPVRGAQNKPLMT